MNEADLIEESNCATLLSGFVLPFIQLPFGTVSQHRGSVLSSVGACTVKLFMAVNVAKL
jgi:hypothetical protein